MTCCARRVPNTHPRSLNAVGGVTPAAPDWRHARIEGAIFRACSHERLRDGTAMTLHSQQAPSAHAPPRDAIIVLPGLIPLPGTTLGAVARRLAVAFDNNAPSAVSFRVADERSTTVGAKELRVITILRRDKASAEPIPVADVIEFDYRTFLTGALATSSPLRQAFAIAATLLFNSGNLVAAVSRPSQRISQKLQVWIGALMFLAVAIYFGVLAYAVIGSVIELITRNATSGGTETWSGSSPSAFFVKSRAALLRVCFVRVNRHPV